MIKINNSASGGAVDVWLYGAIGDWGADAEDISRQLRDISAVQINLRVNSPGGSAYDGLAIMNALRNHPARVVAWVEGLAASAASVIVVGGADEVVMCPNSEMMIHEAQADFAFGGADDLARVIEDLDRVSANIARVYADRAGGTPEDWRARMAAETWYSDTEAVEAGLADRVGKLAAVTEGATASTPRAKAIMNSFRGRRGPRAHGGGSGMDKNVLESLEAIVDRLDRLESASAGDSGPEGDPAPVAGDAPEVAGGDDDPEGEPEAAPEADGDPEGEPEDDDDPEDDGGAVVTVARETYDELLRYARAGREAAEREAVAARAREVETWVAEGRIPAAVRARAEALMERDPDAAREVYGATPAGTIPRAEMGHSGGEPGGDDGASASLSAAADRAGLFGPARA